MRTLGIRATVLVIVAIGCNEAVLGGGVRAYFTYGTGTRDQVRMYDAATDSLKTIFDQPAGAGSLQHLVATPEPSTLALLGIGAALGLLAYAYRRRR